MNKQEEKQQTDFDKRACEAWSEWLSEMHEREERRQQERSPSVIPNSRE